MCANKFQELFDLRAPEVGLLQTIAHSVMEVEAPVTCETFPKAKFVNFFVKLRIYYMLKFKNRELTECKANSKAVKKTAKDKKLSKLKHL